MDNKMKNLILLTLFVFFVGCGGGSGSNSSTNEENKTILGSTKTIAGQELPSGIPESLRTIAEEHTSSSN